MSIVSRAVKRKDTRALLVLVLMLCFPFALAMIASSYLLNIARNACWFTVLYFKTSVEVKEFYRMYFELELIRKFNDEYYWGIKGDDNG